MHDDLCRKCGHLFDPHVLVADTFEDIKGVTGVPVSGWIMCPELECECRQTWSLVKPD
jgi:hypothetical protein